jgi:hypothetical protein
LMLFPLVLVTSSDRRFTKMYSGDGCALDAPEPTWYDVAIAITPNNTGTLFITVIMRAPLSSVSSILVAPPLMTRRA